ncbi:type IV secretory system conjugative DNA transfer family protein [Pseudonocardia sp. CA-142604]|uniref:type IV secretory system conjugative DNA transfer family protein n=1 Tax=Pseudonocardia sp. CA-142604 TaxID=3240024 RepID=UPI003D8E4449
MNAFFVTVAAAALAAGMWVVWPKVTRLLALVRRVVIVGVLPAAALGWWVSTLEPGARWALLAAVAALAVVVGQVLRSRSSSVVARRGRKLRGSNGMATSRQILLHGSSWAMRRKGKRVRPSIGWWRRYFRVSVTEYGMRVVRVGVQWVHVTLQDVFLIVGGPRKGKSALLGGLVLDAPGSVLTTSTRLDVLGDTQDLRRAKRRTIHIYNPGGLGGLPSTVTFDPIRGCEDSTEAIRRAGDMIPENGSSERRHWDGLARDVLAVLMHAAALKGGSMLDVQAWMANPDGTEDEVRALLSRSLSWEALEQSFNQYVTANLDTRSSITTTMRPALAWLAFTPAWESTQGSPLDVEQMIRSGRVDLHALGRREAGTAPLVAAFVGYVARVARNIAADQGGRLDPPLSIILDEAARAASVPLPDWSGDAGGSGIQITVCVQSMSDLYEMYGDHGADRVSDNGGTILVFGGTASAGGLERWTKLVGEREEEVLSHKANGEVVSRSTRLVPAISPAQLRALPEFQAVVIPNGMPPVIGRTPRTWKRWDVRAAKWSTRLAPAREATAAAVACALTRVRRGEPVDAPAVVHRDPTVFEVNSTGEAQPVAANGRNQ